MQIGTDEAGSTEQHKRLSRSNRVTSRVRLFSLKNSIGGSLKSKQQLKAASNTNDVGANAAKIRQLHKKNSINYLKCKADIEDAGGSVFLAA